MEELAVRAAQPMQAERRPQLLYKDVGATFTCLQAACMHACLPRPRFASKLHDRGHRDTAASMLPTQACGLLPAVLLACTRTYAWHSSLGAAAALACRPCADTRMLCVQHKQCTPGPAQTSCQVRCTLWLQVDSQLRACNQVA